MGLRFNTVKVPIWCMVPGPDGAGIGGAMEADNNLMSLLECILSKFSHVSITRIHNLAFLSEHEYYQEFRSRISTADYRPYLEGVYSEEIAKRLDELDGVEERKVRINGERISTMKVAGDLRCNMDDDIKIIVESKVSEFGEVPPEEIQRKIADLEIFRRTDSGDIIEFEN